MTVYSRLMIKALFGIAILGLHVDHTHAASLATQSFAITNDNFADDEVSINRSALFLRKTLEAERVSLKSQLYSTSIEDESDYQVAGAAAYKETRNGVSLGIDYLYYDSSVSVSGGYAKVEDTSESDLALDFSQEYGNGKHHLLMGFSHAWENDSVIKLHNKSRAIHLGSDFGFSPTWKLYAGFEFVNQDGDLENFHSVRRFGALRTQLPEGRTDQRLHISLRNDLDEDRVLTTDFMIFRNDWRQSGNSFKLTHHKNRSEKLSIITHLKIFSQDKSRYYLSSLAAPGQAFYSDHRFLANQDGEELGIKGQWKFRQNADKRIDNLALDFGYTYINSIYRAGGKTENAGHVLHLNLAGSY